MQAGRQARQAGNAARWAGKASRWADRRAGRQKTRKMLTDWGGGVGVPVPTGS